MKIVPKMKKVVLGKFNTHAEKGLMHRDVVLTGVFRAK
jgi:hypothetical protein